MALRTCSVILIAITLWAMARLPCPAMSADTDAGKCRKMLPALSAACPQYNHTSMSRKEQNVTMQHIMDLEPLHASECADNSRRLVCLAYVPLCNPMHPKITAPPCRHLCFAVQSSCLKLFLAINMPWPAMMNCSALPEPPKLCVSPQASPSPSTTLSTSPPHTSFALPNIALFIGLPTGIVIFSVVLVIVVICKCFSFRGPQLPQPGQATVIFSASPVDSRRPLPTPPLPPRAISPYATTSRPASAPTYANVPDAEPNYANHTPHSPASPYVITALY